MQSQGPQPSPKRGLGAALGAAPNPGPGALEPGQTTAAAAHPKQLRSWTTVPKPQFVGGNELQLLLGGQALFPAMCQAIDQAQREVWLATYIFHNDQSALKVQDALIAAAKRGVAVHVVIDGFGSAQTQASLRQIFAATGVQLEVFRPIERWYAWLQPGQLRRLHQKLCVCDEQVAFVGGINIIDDQLDIRHGWTTAPRLDFAVQLRGPLVHAVHATARAMWARARLGRSWPEDMRTLARSTEPVQQAKAMVQQLRELRPGTRARAMAALLQRPAFDAVQGPAPVQAAFLVRDNVRQRRAIERAYVQAITQAKRSVDIAVPYFYPGRRFRQALRGAAKRGVAVRLLLQGKVDYRIAGMAARALYDELRGRGVRIYEYTPAYLHAKVAVVDGHWATVGSSNIDPLSLLLNLEANVVVLDAYFAAQLTQQLQTAFEASQEFTGKALKPGVRGWLMRSAVAWAAGLYMRIAGITGRY